MAAANTPAIANGPARAPVAPPRLASQREIRGCSTISTSASAMNTGTIASNADDGSVNSNAAPIAAPVIEVQISGSARAR